jgi:hypothetical protein
MYKHRLDELICIWDDELLECLPCFTKDELREFIGREVKGGESRERCFDIASILASINEPLSFNEIARRARKLKSFAGLRETSLNKTLSRVLESLKRIGLIVKATYYFRLFNLDFKNQGKGDKGDGPDEEIFKILERYLAKILKEISILKEFVYGIDKKLTKTGGNYSDPFSCRLRKL